MPELPDLQVQLLQEAALTAPLNQECDELARHGKGNELVQRRGGVGRLAVEGGNHILWQEPGALRGTVGCHLGDERAAGLRAADRLCLIGRQIANPDANIADDARPPILGRRLRRTEFRRRQLCG